MYECVCHSGYKGSGYLVNDVPGCTGVYDSSGVWGRSCMHKEKNRNRERKREVSHVLALSLIEKLSMHLIQAHVVGDC